MDPKGDTMDAGLLVVRIVAGLIMAGHGTQKLFGWFGGYGLAGTAGFFEALGFRPGRLFAAAAASSEIAGGVLVALGLLGPIGPAVILSVMIVAALTVHWQHGLFVTSNGIEVPLLYAAVATSLALTGPGLYSLDAWTGLGAVWSPALRLTILGLAVAGGVGSLAARHAQPAAA